MTKSETLRNIIEAINRHDSKAVSVYYADDPVIHDPFFPEPLRGREAVENDSADTFRSFPDWNITIRSILENNESAAVELTLNGTLLGPLGGPHGEIPPTGRRMKLNAAVFSLFNQSGQIVEDRRYYDVATLYEQLGLAK